jgi:NAD(P)-dependent dehydrogenase (short-subunit alcohol dehydrogenase family)
VAQRERRRRGPPLSTVTALADRFRLDGRTAVVTGGLGRLGPIWARVLCEAGARVAAVDLPGVPVPNSLAELQGDGPGTLDVLRADVTSRDSVDRMAIEVEERLGEVDILVNNAGIDAPPDATGETFTLADHDAGVFLRTLEVNVLGAFVCSQVFGSRMAQRGHGAIVNIGSLYASVSPDARLYEHLPTDPPFLKPPAYGASKAALVNLTRYLAAHWGPAGVRVNALSPGGVEGGQDPEFKRKFNERVPLGRMCAPEDLEGPLLFLASDASSYVTGVELLVDGGFTAW